MNSFNDYSKQLALLAVVLILATGVSITACSKKDETGPADNMGSMGTTGSTGSTGGNTSCTDCFIKFTLQGVEYEYKEPGENFTMPNKYDKKNKTLYLTMYKSVSENEAASIQFTGLDLEKLSPPTTYIFDDLGGPDPWFAWQDKNGAQYWSVGSLGDAFPFLTATITEFNNNTFSGSFYGSVWLSTGRTQLKEGSFKVKIPNY